MRSAEEHISIRNLSYLTDIEIPRIDDSHGMLLIGTDSPDVHISLEVRSGGSHQPYAVRSRLGWAVRGPIRTISNTKAREINVNYQQSNMMLEQRIAQTIEFDT
ncbi:hypothetical protein DPMN_178456 [Dreissena polymorpha]|uniref:Peptidase aspartic putative domain-containing protein n=1 Tax=Dreissena polymorpha TaxID=45954 RepID=A0A9D4IIP7_DREPO|nr:hypothetical protein DPMN_178456 [Dreissena polymorpha]